MIEVKMNDPAGVILTTAGQKCDQNIKVVPGFDIPEEYDGAYELLVPTVSGVWYFNETLTLPADETEQIEADISFTTLNGNLKCTRMYGSNPALNYSNEADFTDTVYDDEWFNDIYRTVDFGTEPQEVSEEFYAWLTANAVKQ